ncbi:MULTISPECIES: VanZ family protein [Bacillaceae]|uniref:VanZ family protein n=1 Tax=Evansella alkalicola TaxID=745819 RepID=A0ABS6JRS9_9BACI|nr:MULTISPECIES: VanZ family protein [Bacillaceae]MBU9719982.1 VanZ family protein [Bacillus alkalicola]
MIMFDFNSIIPFIAALVVLLYIIIDFARNRTKGLLKRLLLYSFLFYLVNVIDVTIGHVGISPFVDGYLSVQLIPFYFVKDILLHEIGSWHFWNATKLSFNNFIMLAPLGVYLTILFDVKKVRNAVTIGFLVSLFIETYQLILTYIGLTFRTFNVDDLILNTLGCVLAFIVARTLKELYIHFSNRPGSKG